MKDLCQKWNVKLIFKAPETVWPDWPCPLILRQIYATVHVDVKWYIFLLWVAQFISGLNGAKIIEVGQNLQSKLLQKVYRTAFFTGRGMYLQHCLTCLSSNITIAMLIASAMCVTELRHVSEILSTAFFVAGLATLLQSILGTRFAASCALIFVLKTGV